MQSGKERRSFSLTGPPPGDSKPKIIAAANGKGKAKAKKLLAEKSIQAITGLATDTLNNVVVASTLEGKLYVSLSPSFVSRQLLMLVLRFPLDEDVGYFATRVFGDGPRTTSR
jgi:hypothetical protein